jgi:hypothetical protein
MAEILETPAEQPTEQQESQPAATLQHSTTTRLYLTLAESGPSNNIVNENSDDKLETLCCIAEAI